mgnify:CR=1 FL=1|jgi:hypothetical protein|tara:strand:+ start:212 stop:388 length:177 start_codon:yes stop_codon:yes gene_type:complete
METLNLGSTIALMKVYRWQYEDTDDEIVKEELIEKILDLVDEIEVPQLINNWEGEVLL